MKISIGGVDYEIREITVGEMLPLISGEEVDKIAFQRGLVSSCVSVGGKQLGDDVENLGWSTYKKRSDKALEVCGFSEGLGND